MTDSDARRIRDAFDQDLADYRAPAGFAERARAGGLRRARRQLTYRAACTAAAACAAAVTVAMMAPWTGPAVGSGHASHQPGPGTRAGLTPPASGEEPSAAPSRLPSAGAGGLPSAGAVGGAMLASFDAARDDIIYDKQTDFHSRTVADWYQDWFWPAQPAAGQPVRERDLYAEQIRPANKTVQIIEDYGETYVALASPAAKTSLSETMVCYRTAAATGGGCGGAQGNTPPGTWSRVTVRDEPDASPIAPGSPFDPAALAQAIAQGQWRILGRTQLDGQQAIELSETSSGIIEPAPVLLWVNAQSYLPVRCTTAVSVDDFAYLPPTPDNLKLLQPRIPRGYPRSSP